MSNIFKKESVFIIAEISANHGQDFKQAVALIKQAKACGVDAVKFQLYTADTLTIDVSNKFFKINHPKWGGQTLYQLYQKAYTPWNWFPELKKVADDLGVIFFATAFDKTSVDFLEKLNVPIHKVASFELVDIPLIEYMAKFKKPLIMSTGMATKNEIRDAVNAAKKNGVKDITLLKCVSNYPAEPEDMHLNTITDMKKRFNCKVGLSDHTLSSTVSVAAAVLGGKVIEKHLTLSRKKKTADSFFSITPTELKDLVDQVRIVEKALGNIYYGGTKDEQKMKTYRRSLFVVNDIKKGELFSSDNIRSIRPSYGLEPKYLKKILGKKVKKDIKKGTPLKWSLLED